MSYKEHAERELQALGYNLEDPEDGPNKWIQENLFELLEVFGEQGHSGFSAPYCVNMFKKLALFEPLGPLTGEDYEWVEVQDNMWQNARASNVFKDGDGRTYDIDGKIFVDPDGCGVTNSESCVDIVFPYTPVTQYVYVDHDGNPISDGKLGVDLIAEEIERQQETGRLSEIKGYDKPIPDKQNKIQKLVDQAAEIAIEITRLQRTP